MVVAWRTALRIVDEDMVVIFAEIYKTQTDGCEEIAHNTYA